MQPLPHILFIPLMVQAQQPCQHLMPDFFRDGVTNSLGHLVEAVSQVQVAPAIGRSRNVVHLHMQFTQDELLQLLVNLCQGWSWQNIW